MQNGLVDFAAQVASNITDFFELDYFEISEAVPPKIDLVALPDFPAGGFSLVLKYKDILFLIFNI